MILCVFFFGFGYDLCSNYDRNDRFTSCADVRCAALQVRGLGVTFLGKHTRRNNLYAPHTLNYRLHRCTFLSNGLMHGRVAAYEVLLTARMNMV